MKSQTKFLIITLLALLFFTISGAEAAFMTLSPVRQAENKAFAGLISMVKEKYPELGNDEIVRILNEPEINSEVSSMLSSYGITDRVWAAAENDSNSLNLVIIFTCVCAGGGLIFLLLVVILQNRHRHQMMALTDYLKRVNSGSYELLPESNTEDESSLLRNEIYKTTVMLREQSELQKKGRESLKDSLSDISHQLKTPLTSINIMLDSLIEDEEMPAEIRSEFLHDIRNSANHISFLVQSLLKLSKLDADSVEFSFKDEDAGDILKESAKNTDVLSELKNVRVICKSGPPVSLCCDKKWLTEAVTNIVKNCIEHTESGGRVTLSASRNKLYTKLTISDTGCGIEKEELPHIFERFYKTKSSDENSVGIGLALTKAIVEKQGGYISAESEPGKGSTFIIRFFHNSANYDKKQIDPETA